MESLVLVWNQSNILMQFCHPTLRKVCQVALTNRRARQRVFPLYYLSFSNVVTGVGGWKRRDSSPLQLIAEVKRLRLKTQLWQMCVALDYCSNVHTNKLDFCFACLRWLFPRLFIWSTQWKCTQWFKKSGKVRRAFSPISAALIALFWKTMCSPHACKIEPFVQHLMMPMLVICQLCSEKMDPRTMW